MNYHHEEHQEEEYPEPWYKGPMKYIIALFIILLMIFTVIPAYKINVDPSPGEIPSVDDVFNSTADQKKFSVESKDDFYTYLDVKNTKKVADKIVTKSCREHEVCDAKSIFLFVRDEIKYVNDPLDYEFVKNPIYTLEVGSGDCDDQSVLLASLLRSVGYRTRFVFVPGHVYVQAKIPNALDKYKNNGWINLDPTCEDCNFGEKTYNRAEKEFV